MSSARLLFPAVLSATALLAPSVGTAKPAVVTAATWSKATMAAATSYFPEATAAMVVGVGEGAQPVAGALLETLQASERLELAIDARSLGDVDGLADEAIVQRAFARPIKRVAIVRVFPAGESVKAVVTVYAAQGQVTTAFTLAPGKPLAENPTPEVAEDGVRRDELSTVQSTSGGETGVAPAAADDGEVTYQRQQVVGISHYGVVNFENVTFFKNGRMIPDTPSLYEALGMESEATEYRRRAAERNKWGVWGAGLGTVGVLGACTFGTWWLSRSVSTDIDPTTGVETESSTTVPMLLTAGSVAAIYFGVRMMRSHPAPVNLTTDEAVALVDARKAKQRRAGGLRAPAPEVHFAPAALPSGGGFVMAGSF